MKKLLFVILLIVSLCAMFACGETDNGQENDGGISNGESGDGESGDGESGDGESGDGESGDGESGDGESGDGESGDGESGDGESGDGESGDGESGDGESGDGESGDEETVKYTVTWKDENGTELARTEVDVGSIPSYTYTKEDTAEWDYTVEGWSATSGGEVISSLPTVNEETTYYAIVSQVKQQYTVSFNTQGGSTIASITVDYGTAIEAPKDTPKYSGHKFVGWSTSSESLTAVDFDALIVENKTYYAIWNEVVDISALLFELMSNYKSSPNSYIPETMRANYTPNLIDPSDVISDYSYAVDVSDILYGGFGQQWNMIVNNINQSQIFFNTLTTVEAVMTTSLAIFNNYLDENPDNVAHHTIASGIYSITLDFDGSDIYYVLEYTATLPILGEQSVQIALSMDTESKDKVVRIQLGDANALTYKVTDNGYEFAIKYLGVRRAYFSISEDKNGAVSGSIYEYLTASGVGISSAAEFYIQDGYVYAVGNKADGILGFTGYICETYDVETGKLLGYEVQETLSAIKFNTLWFNIADIDGIDSIRYSEKTQSTDAAFYINGSSEAFATVKVGLFEDPLRASTRKFDIEFRTQYFYYYDTVNENYEEVAVQVPMFFIQEEDFDGIEATVGNANDITIEILTKNADISAIMEAYDDFLPIFIENKELVTVDNILIFIGNKIEFN